MNQKKIPKYLIETDVLADHLITGSENESYLIKLMKSGICFTSVLNASELYLLADSHTEIQRVNDVLYSIKVLGIHSRYSLSVSKYKDRFDNLRDALFYILAELNKLTIVSLNPDRFSNINVNSFHPEFIISGNI
ncbi:MAG: PIN domain-containing protein [Ignavibacteriaceae bacterium]|jgi:predicted nucleic acid-binding protein|nr:PIN domain-containing protein [Ignavibacteriaceae bacterium]